MDSFALIAGLLALAASAGFLLRTRGSLGSLIIWGGLTDAGLILCGIGTQTVSGSTGALLVAAYAVATRLLATAALFSLKPSGMADKAGFENLRGVIHVAPWRAILLCFALVAALGVSPFGTPEGRLFVLYALAGKNLWVALFAALPSTMALWLTAEAVMSLCMTSPEHKPAIGNAPASAKPLVGVAVVLTCITAALGVGHAPLADAAAAVFGSSSAELPRLFGSTFSWPYTLLYLGAFPLLLRAGTGQRLNITPVWDLYPVGVAGLAFAVFLFSDVSPEARLFGLIATGIGLLISLYSMSYIHDDGRKPVYNFFLLITFAAVYNIFVAANAGSLSASWELMGWASFILIAWDRTHAARRAAVRYLVICGAGAYILIPALFVLTGPTLSLSASATSANNISPFVLGTALFCALLGFATKTGLVPLHSWLPAAHPEAPSAISAPLSGVLTKTGLFGMVLALWFITGNTMLEQLGSGPSGLTLPGAMLVTMGIVTMAYGEWMALKQDDIKRMLAYSTIGQLGEIAAVLGLGTWLALTGGLAHVLNHAIMKDLLFLGAGALVLRAGSRKLSDLAGLGRFMPCTVTCMSIGLVSIMGLPPFNGFVSKYIMIVACMQAGHIVLAAALLVASLVGAIYYMRILRTLVFDTPSAELETLMRQRSPAKRDVPLSMRVPLLLLAGLCVVFGVAPQSGLSLVTPVVNMLVEAGRLPVGQLPDIFVGWPIYVILPMAGALLPLYHRYNPDRAALSAASVLVITTILTLILGTELDTLSYCMALAVPLLGALNMAYARSYMAHSHTQWRFYCFFLLMTGGLLGVASSHNLFGFFTFWEIMSSWALYFAIAHEGTREALREAFKYFLFNVAGAACLFLGIGILAGVGGASSFSGVRETLLALPPVWSTTVMFLLATGFIMKAAQVTFRIDWQMHPNLAPTPVSGYISSVLLKIAVFGLAKLFLAFGGIALIMEGDPFHQATIMRLTAWAGGFTLLYAALKAMVQEKIKMIFIWSTVSQIGYMVLGVALGTSLGVAGGLLHMFSHMLFKDLLFLVAGAVMFATHRENLRDLGGLGRVMPYTMGCFALAAISAAGIPPSSGFMPKWLIYQALMQQGDVLLALISLAGSAVTLAYLARAMHVIFLGQPSPAAAQAQEVPRAMRLPMLVLAGAIALFGFLPGLMLWPINSILTQSGLSMLDASLFGINSGAGAWNALALNTMTFVAFGGTIYAMRRLLARVPMRTVDPHACGLELGTAFAHRQPPETIFQALTSLLGLTPGNSLPRCCRCHAVHTLLSTRNAALQARLSNGFATLGEKYERWATRLGAPFTLEAFAPPAAPSSAATNVHGKGA